MSEGAVACWSCGRDNEPGRDFCEFCGEYLSWAPTGYVPAVGAETGEQAAAAGAEGEGGGDVAVDAPTILAPVAVPGLPDLPPATGEATLRMEPADPGSIGIAGVPAVEAGHSTAFMATIRNESRIVDNYELTVAGLPDGWSVISPAGVYLVPLGTVGGSSEQEIRVDLAPPRLFSATAGIWTFELVARSRTTGATVARAAAQFEVLPFTAWSTEVTPLVRSGRLRARYRVAVRNDGNALAELTLVAVDEAERVRASFAVGRLAIRPGEVGNDELTIRPPWPLPVGRKREHRVGVDALPAPPPEEEAEGEESLQDKAKDAATGKAKDFVKGIKVDKSGVKLPKLKLPKLRPPKLTLDAATLAKLKGERSGEVQITGRPVVFRQKPLIPLWFIALLLLAAAVAVGVYLLLPKKVEVPQLIGTKDAFTADKRLRAEGLVLAQPIQRRTDPNAPPGSVVSQSPESGEDVEEGETVAIEVAAGTTKVGVPRLAGLTRVNADERLRDAELSLGDVQPADAPDNFVVRSQIPRVGLSVPRGTPVRVMLKAPPKKKKGKGGKGGAGGADGKGGKPKSLVIPAIAGMPAAEYAQALEKLKLKPKQTRVTAAVAAGKVLSVKPSPGTKAKEGDAVQLRVSGGSPALAFETEGLVQLFDPVTDKEVGQIPEGEGTAVEATFTPDGKQVLYRADRNLVLSGVGKDSKKRTLYSGEDEFVLPSMAPDGETVAVVRRLEDDGDLCFGRSSGKSLGALCLADDGWDVTGRPAWRKDGKVLLVAGRKQGDSKTFGIRLYQSSKAYSTSPQDWSGRIATDVSTPGKGVLVMAWSADGKKLAAVTNLLSAKFELVTAPAADLELVEPKSTKVEACDFAWRPDGKEIAIVEGDAGCASAAGKLKRITLATPKKPNDVADAGRNPVYRPVG